MNKLEAELKEQKKIEEAELETDRIKQAIYEGKELRKFIPSYKAVQEGGKSHNRLCWIHTNEKYMRLHFDGMDHVYYICPSCGSVCYYDVYEVRHKIGYLDPSKESLASIKGVF